MELLIDRDRKRAKDTSGILTVAATKEWLGYILEDRVRTGGKVPAETAIPAGRYEITITMSPRFQKRLPLLLDVPGFAGIRIHAGNDADDTEGCLLPGLQRETLPDGTQRVTNSREAASRLQLRIQNALARSERVWITIR